MSLEELIAAMSAFLATFGVNLSNEQWGQYYLALADVNPGDLDDAMADLRKSHGFRNAPLPADILARVHVHRKRRQNNPSPEPEPISVTDGELREHTIKGIGTLKIRVLPDDHPALQRFACLSCKDTGWVERPELNPGKQATFSRCPCLPRNPVLQTKRMRRSERLVKA